jgi:DNA-binding HxlR family transcriptional regulator
MSKRIFKDTAAHVPHFCRPTVDVLSRVGDKWSLSVLGSLTQGRMRFSQLHAAVPGISQRMLTMTLRALERDGLVARFVQPTIPPRVDYELTERGWSMISALSSLGEWASANSADIQQSRRNFDSSSDGA